MCISIREKFVQWRERYRYRFENFMASGGISIFISLVFLFILCFLFAVLVRGIILLFFPEYQYIATFPDHVWIIFLEMTDPGNMNRDTGSSPQIIFAGIVAGMLGVVIFSMLIAFITTQLNTLLDDLKKGHSKVIESDQTLILGWSERVPGIISELILANESEKDASIVILAENEKEDMDDELAAIFSDTKTTRIITRTGNTSSLTNLFRVSADKAKSAIILATCPESATEEEKRTSDAKVLKTILALKGCQQEQEEINIVAELFFDNNRDLLSTFESDCITSVDSWDILGKILVQTSRTGGLAVVYNEILSFDGCELYFHEADWNEINFYDLLYHFPDGVPMGIRRKDGTLVLRPCKEDVMKEGDEVLIIAEDDSTIEFRKDPVIRPRDLPFQYRKFENRVERELILGWHGIASIIIREYSDYLLDGSSIDLMIHDPSTSIKHQIEKLQEDHPSLVIRLIDKDPLSLADLSSMDPYGYDNVIILSQSEQGHSPERADSETLVMLLLLRKIFRETPTKSRETKLITQILNTENQDLVARSDVDDFLISNKMITMIFAQLSEESDIKLVYDDIFEEEGSEIYLKPASLYFDSFPIDVNFADMMGIACKRDEICIGLRINQYSMDHTKNFGIILNPAKDSDYTLHADDSLVVLAEDEL